MGGVQKRDAIINARDLQDGRRAAPRVKQVENAKWERGRLIKYSQTRMTSGHVYSGDKAMRLADDANATQSLSSDTYRKCSRNSPEHRFFLTRSHIV